MAANSFRPATPVRCGCGGRCWTAGAIRCRTRCWRSGSRIRTAGWCAAGGSLRRDGWTFTGWGRAATDSAGRYSFSTLRPGATEPGRAPFFAVTVFARGLTDRLFTRAYLPGDPALLAADPLLAGLDADRRATLIAAADDQGLVFDVRLQGERETVFLTFPGHA